MDLQSKSAGDGAVSGSTTQTGSPEATQAGGFGACGARFPQRLADSATAQRLDLANDALLEITNIAGLLRGVNDTLTADHPWQGVLRGMCERIRVLADVVSQCIDPAVAPSRTEALISTVLGGGNAAQTDATDPARAAQIALEAPWAVESLLQALKQHVAAPAAAGVLKAAVRANAAAMSALGDDIHPLAELEASVSAATAIATAQEVRHG